MTSGFKPPSLLRRATTSQVAGADKNGISYGAGGSGGVAGTERAAGGVKEVKTGGSRRSNIGYFARERVTGGKAVLREAERRRQEGLRRLGSERSGLGELVAGSFE